MCSFNVLLYNKKRIIFAVISLVFLIGIWAVECRFGFADSIEVLQEEKDLFFDGDDFAEYLSVYFELPGSAGLERINLFVRDNDAYIMLPSYVDASEIIYRKSNDIYSVYIDDNLLKNNSKIEVMPGQENHIMKIEGYDKDSAKWRIREYNLHIMQSKNLPAIFISTSSGSLDYINESKENHESGYFRCVKADGTQDSFAQIEKIRARGVASFEYEKKPYRLKFSEPTNVCGMGEYTDWILQGNAYDRTRQRNAVCYSLAFAAGVNYVTNYQYVDVYFNGRYYGNYLIMEPIEVTKGRLDINKSDGMLFELAHKYYRLDRDCFYNYEPNTKRYWQIDYPKRKNLDFGRADANWQIVKKATEIIYRLAPEDSLEELSKYIDLDSFASMYIVDVITDDLDCGKCSYYYYMNGSDNLLYAGPVWDYDKTLGVLHRAEPSENFTIYGGSVSEILIRNNAFRELVIEKLHDFEEPLEYVVNDFVAENTELIKDSVYMDLARWTWIDKKAVEKGGFYENTNYLQKFLENRYSLMCDVAVNPQKYVNVYIDYDNGIHIILKKGEHLSAEQIEQLKYYSDNKDLYTSDGVLLDTNTVINDDIIVKSEW